LRGRKRKKQAMRENHPQAKRKKAKSLLEVHAHLIQFWGNPYPWEKRGSDLAQRGAFVFVSK